MSSINDTLLPPKGMGYNPDLPDFRDRSYKITSPELVGKPLPSSVDLRITHPFIEKIPILDQGPLGSCVSNAVSTAIAFSKLKQKVEKNPDLLPVIDPTIDVFLASRLFIYYNCRRMEGTVSEDAGAMIRDGIKSVNRQGACKEDTWPYDIPVFTHKPSNQAYREALDHQVLLYRRIPSNNIESMKGCLAEGYPFVFGFSVYESFQTIDVAKTGITPMPKLEEKMLGGHCVIAESYSDEKQMFRCRNSWSSLWGEKGFFYLPYDYLSNSNLSEDMWVITSVEEGQRIKDKR